jgi:hypothetical protein
MGFKMWRLLFFLLLGCVEPLEAPDGVAFAFVCRLHGIKVLEGWLTVPEAIAERAEAYDLDQYFLECETPEMKGLKCRTTM